MNIKKYENAQAFLNKLFITNTHGSIYKIKKRHDIFVDNKFSYWNVNYITKSLYMPCKFKGEFIEIKPEVKDWTT